MIESVLREMGLSGNEIRVYLMLLENGLSGVGNISSKTKIHRRNVYDCLDMLREKGAVSYTVKNGRKFYEASDPKIFIKNIDEKKERFNEILPQLMAKQKRNDSVEDVRVYTGVKGRKIVFEDKLNYPEEQYVLGGHIPNTTRLDYLNNYHLRRCMKKINVKKIFHENKVEDAKFYLSNFEFVEARIISQIFSSPIAINIYGNKVALFMGSGKTEALTVLIEDDGLNKDFRNYFNMLWDIGRKVD
ncbi:MAG: hypothetical protein GQ477_05785 [Nanohaloarchaea archaeon]|nr:hypothetical protein [Candidatus Nanohaloarchaea archaeon]